MQMQTSSSQGSQGFHSNNSSVPIEVPQFKEDLTMKQISEKAGKNSAMFHKPKKKLTNNAPHLSPSNQDFMILNEENASFIHSATNYTHIVYNLTGTLVDQLRGFMKNELDIFREIYKNFTNNAYNNGYSKSYHIVRNINSIAAMKKSKSSGRYQEFVKEILKSVYGNLYDIKPSSAKLELSDIQNMRPEDIEKVKGEDELIAYDLFSEPIMAIVISLQEALDKITDDEINNLFVLCCHNFVHPINWLLSPVAISLSFFHMQLLGMKKPHKDDPYYTKANLPRVTYLSLTGLFSEIDIDVLNAYSDNVQIINIYDENTGGPSSILNQGEYYSEPSFRDTDSVFQKISKLLLIPLKCSKEKETGKPYQPNDLLTIFQDVVIRSIEKFKPSYIVLNCSLIFDKTSKTPFWLDEETFGHIVHLLCQLCDNKVLIYPFKLPQKPAPESRDNELLLAGIRGYSQKPQLQTRLQFIWDRYFIPYNEIYLRDCFVQAFEALSGLKDATLFNSQHLKHKYGVNPILNKMLYQITRYYKQHPYYSFLYSKAFGPLARATTNYQLKDGIGKITGAANKNTTIKTIPVWTPKGVNLVKLNSMVENSENNWEITLDEDSQYLVDYSANPQTPNIHIFNAKVFQVSNDQTLKFHGKSSHVKVSVEFQDPNTSGSLNENLKTIPLEDNPEITENLSEAGLCQCGPYVFQVYGTNLTTKEDTTSILYHNFEEKKSYKMKLKGGNHTILPRHAVTACAFQKNGEYFLYVFGGQMQPNTQYGEGKKIVKPLDIIDIIEIYSTSNPKSGEWNYENIPKDTDLKGNVFIPYNKSYASYQKNKDGKDVIVIMGGELFKQSCFQWTFPVFEFNIDKRTFAPFQVHVTDFKENPSRKTIINNTHKRPVVTVAVADNNRNFMVNLQQKVATFVVPLKEDNLYYMYSYNWESNECEYEEYQLKKEQEKQPPPDTLNNNNNIRRTPISQRLSTKIGYFTREKVEKFILLQLVCTLKENNGLLEKIDELEKLFWEKIRLEAVKEEILIYFQNKGQKPMVTGLFKVLLDDKEFKEIIRFDDHRTVILKSFIQPTQTESLRSETKVAAVTELEPEDNENSNSPVVFAKRNDNKVFGELSEILGKLGAKANAINLSSSSIIMDSMSTAAQSNFPSSSFSSPTTLTQQDKEYLKESVQKLKLIIKDDDDALDATNNDKSNLADTSQILAPLYNSLMKIIDTEDKTKSIGLRILEEINKSLEASFNDSRTSNKRNTSFERQGDQNQVLSELSRVHEKPPTEYEESKSSQRREVSQTKEVSITKSPPPKTVEVRHIEVQTDISECREEEKHNNEVEQFKQALITPIPYRVFFNGSKSELIISDPTNPADLVRLRFKVKRPGYNPYEDISFEFSPSSVTICNNIVACYIDNKFKIRYPEIFSTYKNQVLYADIEACLKAYKEDGKNYLVFRKLFLITQNDEIMNRCLMLNEDVLGFFGGTVYKLKGKKSSSESRYCSMYLLQKFQAISQNSNDFRDTEIDDEMENVKGECFAIKTKDWTFVCARTSPSCFEVFDKNGGMDDSAEFPKKFEDYFVHANLVNFRGKEEILIILCKQSEAFEFLLYDVAAKAFETKKITLVPIDSPDNEKFQTVFSGFEQFEVTTNINQPLENVLIHSFRTETAKIITCKIQVN